MVPDKFNMVDMGGIDLIMMQGEAVLGLYDKLMAAISNCRYQCLYNWVFDGVLIPPTYVQLEDVDSEVFLNEGVSVTSDDVIHIYSIVPPAPEPEIIPLLAEENGVYNAPSGKDGFNPVTVNVPSYTPVINSITITENGTYNAPAGVDGYSPVLVNVSGGNSPFLNYIPYTTVPMSVEYIDSTSFSLEFEIKTGLSQTTVGFIFAPSGISLKAKLIEIYPSAGFGIPQTGLCAITAAMPNVISQGTGRISYHDHSVIDSEYSYSPVEGTSYFYAGVYQAPNNAKYKFLITKQ